jgi:hypothetical protein
MVRLIRVTLLIGCLAAQLRAQAPKEQGSAGQTAAAAAKPEYPLDSYPDFSAVMVGSIMEIGEGSVEAHIYRSGKLMRMEGVEGHGYLITDLSTLETYGVSTGPCMHDSHPFFRASPFAAARPGSTVERVPAGKETLDGHSCQIEDITVSSSKPGKPLKMRFWEAEDLQGFPIRIDYLREGGRDSTVRYKNVVLGPQDPTLFIHPKSCQSTPQKDKPKTHKAPAKARKPSTGGSQK